MRRSHDALQFKAAAQVCPDCGELKLYHHVCESCGNYRGEQVIETE
jgi:large subunit ribosomal protein L32